MSKLVSKLLTGGGLFSVLVFSHDSYVKGKSYLEKEHLLHLQEKTGSTITGRLGINPEYYRLKDQIKEVEKSSQEDLWLPEPIREPLFNILNNFWTMWEQTAGSVLEKMFLSFGVTLTGTGKILVFATILLIDLLIIRAFLRYLKDSGKQNKMEMPVININNYISPPNQNNKELKQDVATFVAWGVLLLAVRGTYSTVKEDGGWFYTELIRYFYPAKPVPFMEQTFLFLDIKVWQAIIILFFILLLLAYIFDLHEKVKSIKK